MVTMSYRPLAEAVIANCPPDSFAGLVSGDEVTAGKPDPEPYLRGAALLDLDPADCAALEDSKPGLASAEAAGTIAIGIPHFIDLEPRPGRILWESLEGRSVADLRRLRAQRSA
jgi:beta-phosphoglucomutase-like phosphatase (HAD superfamily)